jgi:hypothetical protein
VISNLTLLLAAYPKPDDLRLEEIAIRVLVLGKNNAETAPYLVVFCHPERSRDILKFEARERILEFS